MLYTHVEFINKRELLLTYRNLIFELSSSISQFYLILYFNKSGEIALAGPHMHVPTASTFIVEY